MSRVLRKPDFCICEDKDADQLRGDREADQRLCFRYINSTIPLLSKYEISSIYRVATIREKSLENEFFSRSGKSQGISILVREI